MSEIFDFLKKTESEPRKKVPIFEPDTPGSEFNKSSLMEAIPEPAVEEPPPMNVEIWESEGFDLTNASLQIRSALDPLSLVGEQFRLLRSKLGLIQKQRGIKTILVTSTAPEEGKTFTASGLTAVFAHEPGKRVILIDGDMRKPKSGWNFGLNNSTGSTGLSSVLQGDIPFHQALLTSVNPKFSFLPAGMLPKNPSELLSSPVLEQTIKTAAQSFDLVIIDSPPALSLSDTTILAPLCDAVLLVIRADSTPAKLIEDAINQIGRDRICGVVINRQKHMHTSRYYYQHYYRSSKRN